MFNTIDEIRQANRRIGHHWFEDAEMKFFNTKIESELMAGKYFITSDSEEVNKDRRYSIRRANPSGSIDTIGEFRAYRGIISAIHAVEALISEEAR